MCSVVVDATGLDAVALSRRLADELLALSSDAVVHIRIDGELAPGAEAALRAEYVRSLYPATMTVEIRLTRRLR